MTPAPSAGSPVRATEPSGRRTLLVACGVHALHDGFTDLLYILLPLWQAEFSLGYAAVGALRAAYAGAMAGFQVPSGSLSERLGGAATLTLGTAVAAAGFLVMGLSGGLAALAVGLILSGVGSSTQHPVGSDLVARAYSGARSRAALGTYNFAGDLGKMTLPAATALLLTLLPWRTACLLLGGFGLAAAVAILILCRPPARETGRETPASAAAATRAATPRSPAGSERGFVILLATGVLDSAVRMAFLTFLPFLLAGKGAGLSTIGTALTLVFAGGAAGKLVCGFLGTRIGILPTVLITEGGTALAIVALLPVGLDAALALLPVLGIMLNGTSSVLYGTVPELVATERRARAFGLFYTGAVGGGAAAPAVFGLLGDALGIPGTTLLIAGMALLT